MMMMMIGLMVLLVIIIMRHSSYVKNVSKSQTRRKFLYPSDTLRDCWDIYPQIYVFIVSFCCISSSLIVSLSILTLEWSSNSAISISCEIVERELSWLSVSNCISGCIYMHLYVYLYVFICIYTWLQVYAGDAKHTHPKIRLIVNVIPFRQIIVNKTITRFIIIRASTLVGEGMFVFV